MRVATLLLTALAVAPSLTLAAPINPAHYEELEARWNPFHLSAKQKQNVKDFGRGFAHGFGSVMKKAAPVALSLAPMILKREEEEMELLKREEEQHLERRISEKAKNFWRKVGHGAQKVWDVLGPTAVELTAKHYKLISRDVDTALVARALEFADAEEELHKRDEIPEELFERDFMPEELVERDFSPIEVEELERRGIHDFELEELERRGLSEKAKNFWRKVGHGAEHVFEQLGPIALQIGAHMAGGRGAAPSPASRPKPTRANTI